TAVRRLTADPPKGSTLARSKRHVASTASTATIPINNDCKPNDSGVYKRANIGADNKGIACAATVPASITKAPARKLILVSVWLTEFSDSHPLLHKVVLSPQEKAANSGRRLLS